MVGDRDRFADIIDSFFGVDSAYFGVDKYELADHLLSNNAIVQPCHIGQTIYQLYRKYNGDSIVRQGKVSAIQQKADKSWKIRITMNSYVFEITPDKIGETVFLTKEEAENALKYFE